jgi:hypothetical protein
MTVTLSYVELAATVGAAVALAATDASALSRLGITYVAKRLGVEPGEIYRYDSATSGDPDETADTTDSNADTATDTGRDAARND